MAQLVEHIVHIDGVTGSSPVATTHRPSELGGLFFASMGRGAVVRRGACRASAKSGDDSEPGRAQQDHRPCPVAARHRPSETAGLLLHGWARSRGASDACRASAKSGDDSEPARVQRNRNPYPVAATQNPQQQCWGFCLFADTSFLSTVRRRHGAPRPAGIHRAALRRNSRCGQLSPAKRSAPADIRLTTGAPCAATARFPIETADRPLLRPVRRGLSAATGGRAVRRENPGILPGVHWIGRVICAIIN